MNLKVVTLFLTVSASLGLLCGCKEKEQVQPKVMPPVKVTAMSVANSEQREISRTYSGTVESSTSANVSFSIPGTIAALYAKEGDRVEQGKVLAKLQEGDYQNAVNIAQAQLAEAEDAYARLQKLHDANALPDIKWVEIEQKVKQAQNAAEVSRRTLSETTVTAPMSGVITKRFAEPGQNVAPIQPLYEITAINDLTINISVPENEVNNFKVGQSADIVFENASNLHTHGTVSEKAVIADPLTRTYKIKIKISSENGKILPGMVGTVKFVEPVPEGLKNTNILLPSKAVLLAHDNSTFVWVINNGKAERRFVKADELVADGVMVTNGLMPGDTVIIEGMQKVGTGTIVNPVIK